MSSFIEHLALGHKKSSEKAHGIFEQTVLARPDVPRHQGGAVSNRLKQTALVFVVVLAAAQFVRPERANPAIDPNHTIQAQMGTASGLVAVLDRACSDCHTNMTVWPWYTQVAPLSWLMAYGVREGRHAVNFSEWTAYQPARQHALLVEACRDVSTGKMPGAYAVLHPDMRLSAQDIETICAASRQAEGHTAP
jgi:hypothetical protein